jgi:hypothetical protein
MITAHGSLVGGPETMPQTAAMTTAISPVPCRWLHMPRRQSSTVAAPDVSDDNDVFSCEARQHAEQSSTGQHLELLFLIAARGSLAGASRRPRPQWRLHLRLAGGSACPGDA